MKVYHPSVCHQTDGIHTHYNIVMLRPDKFATDLDALRLIANRIGGQTAGQVVLRIQDLIRTGLDLNQYGIDYMQVEQIPTYQVCHKGEDTSPSIDWDKWLFVTPPVSDEEPHTPGPVYIGRIQH